MSKILDFVIAVRCNTENTYSEFHLGNVYNNLGQTIASKIGITSISGANKLLTSSGVIHAFVRHGTQKSEDERGQVGITNEDFDYLSDILSNPTDITLGDKMNRKKEDTIIFSKKIKGKVYNVIMCVVKSNKEKTLIFNTMFIKK